VAAAATVTGVARTATATASPRRSKDGGKVVVRADAPLTVDGSAEFDHVELRGGQIVTRGGGVIHIARLSKS